MSRTDHPRDAVVVGAGLGGLASAALLARAGWNVVLAEAGPSPGGYAHAFRRDGYTFDPAIHMIPEAPFVENMLAHLGVADSVDFVPVESLYSARFPTAHLEVGHAPGDNERFLQPHIRAFPKEEQRLRSLFALFEDVFYEATALPFRVLSADLGDAESRYPNLVRYRTASVKDVLDEYLDDDRLKAALTASWSYLGLPPSRLSFLLFAQMVNVLLRGASYCVGGIQRLVDALVEAFEGAGGELLVDSRVTRIVVENNTVRGVEVGDERLTAPIVISGADGYSTLTELLGAEHLSEAVDRRLRRLQPSISSFLLFAGTGLDLEALGASPENFLFDHWEHDRTYDDILEGRPGGMAITIPTLLDAQLAPPKHHAVVVRALAPYDAGTPWPELKERYTERVLHQCDSLFQGFSSSLTLVESSTPLTLERYTGNYRGAAFGWANSPTQAGNKRLPHTIGIDGLYLTGHWTQEGTGALRVLFSAASVAAEALADAGSTAIVPDFKKRRGGPMQANEEKKELVRRFFDQVWNRGNFDFIDEYYADNFTLHALWQNTALGGSREADTDAAKAAIRGWRSGFPDLRVTIEEQVVEGELVTSRHVARGTNDRPFNGIPPTRRRGEMSGMTTMRIVDGKITDAWTMWDVVGLMQQLGVIPDPAEGERNKAIVRRFYQELWNEGRMEVADELFDENFIGHAPGNAEDSRGPEGVKQLVQAWRTAAPDLTVEIISQQAEGERVATRFVCTGTQTGPLLGIPPTGRQASMAGMAITHVRDGKVISDWGEFDLLGLMQQLGVAPGPPGRSEDGSRDRQGS